MKKNLKLAKRIVLTAGVAILFGCGFTFAENPIHIKKQGFFASGGTVTEPFPGEYDFRTNWLSQMREGNTAHVDHASTFYQIPAKEKASPVVFLHGYGQSRTGWLTTPDGREGWSTMALRNGRAVFLVDMPRTGEAGSSVKMTAGFPDVKSDDAFSYLPGDQAWYTHFRIGRIAPELYKGSQFPEGKEAQNQFFRQMTPNAGVYEEKLFGGALSEVLADASKMTGKKTVYITHSRGRRVGWQTDDKNMAALIAVEPGGTPVVGSEEYKKFLSAKIPMVVIFGDYIGERGPKDIKSRKFWKTSEIELWILQSTTAQMAAAPKSGIRPQRESPATVILCSKKRTMQNFGS